MIQEYYSIPFRSNLILVQLIQLLHHKSDIRRRDHASRTWVLLLISSNSMQLLKTVVPPMLQKASHGYAWNVAPSLLSSRAPC